MAAAASRPSRCPWRATIPGRRLRKQASRRAGAAAGVARARRAAGRGACPQQRDWGSPNFPWTKNGETLGFGCPRALARAPRAPGLAGGGEMGAPGGCCTSGAGGEADGENQPRQKGGTRAMTSRRERSGARGAAELSSAAPSATSHLQGRGGRARSTILSFEVPLAISAAARRSPRSRAPKSPAQARGERLTAQRCAGGCAGGYVPD